MNIKSTLLAAGLLLGASAAHADLVETSVPFTAQLAPFSTQFLVPRFDSSLGTLNSIVLSLTTHIVGQLDFFNNTGSAQPFTNAFASVPVTLTLTAPDDTVLTATATATATQGSGVAAVGFSTFPGVASTATASANVLPINFASYIGLGNANATFAATRTTGTSGATVDSGLLVGNSATADGVFTIRYDYDPVSAVPVPAAAWLLGSGLLSIGATLRRRRHR